jgi:hypothetical protein
MENIKTFLKKNVDKILIIVILVLVVLIFRRFVVEGLNLTRARGGGGGGFDKFDTEYMSILKQIEFKENINFNEPSMKYCNGTGPDGEAKEEWKNYPNVDFDYMCKVQLPNLEKELKDELNKLYEKRTELEKLMGDTNGDGVMSTDELAALRYGAKMGMR